MWLLLFLLDGLCAWQLRPSVSYPCVPSTMGECEVDRASGGAAEGGRLASVQWGEG